MSKYKRELKGMWECENCHNVFDFEDAEETEEDFEGKTCPICPECDQMATKKLPIVAPKDYMDIGCIGILHEKHVLKCNNCADGYPRQCKCGGWIHCTKKGKNEFLKCDVCGFIPTP